MVLAIIYFLTHVTIKIHPKLFNKTFGLFRYVHFKKIFLKNFLVLIASEMGYLLKMQFPEP